MARHCNDASICHRLHALAVFAVLLLGLQNVCTANPMPTVQVDANVRVHGDEIHLADIARFDQVAPELALHLGSVVIGRAPLPGNIQRYERDYIRMKMKQAHVDLSSLAIHIPAQVVVGRHSMPLPTDQVRKAVVQRLEKAVAWSKHEIDVRLRAGSEKLLLPAGNLQMDVQLPADRTYLGSFPVAVELKVDGRFVRRLWVKAAVTAYAQVVVTKRPLGRYQRISAEDIALTELEIGQGSSELMTRLDQVVGKRTRRVVLAGAPITAALIEKAPIIRRGDIVTILAESGGLRITTMGEAKARGVEGERIEVVNLDSNKTIYARVLNPQTVQVDLAQRRPQ